MHYHKVRVINLFLNKLTSLAFAVFFKGRWYNIYLKSVLQNALSAHTNYQKQFMSIITLAIMAATLYGMVSFPEMSDGCQ